METQMCGNVLKQVQFLCLSFYTQQGICFSHQGHIPNQDTWEILWSKWWMWKLVWLPVWVVSLLWHCRACQLLFVERWSTYCVPVWVDGCREACTGLWCSMLIRYKLILSGSYFSRTQQHNYTAVGRELHPSSTCGGRHALSFLENTIVLI